MDDSDDHGRDKSGLSDSIRKALLTGLSAVFMTEEGIRSALSDMRLPKEALAYLAQQTERTRRELFRAFTDELKSFLTGVDWTREIRKALIGLKVEVKAVVRFGEDAPHAEVSTRVSDAGARPRKRG